MVDCRSKHIRVSNERRKDPRLEFQCKVLLGDRKGALTVTDLSLGGIFVEVEEKTGFELGSLVSIAVKFPTEQKAVLLKAKIVNVNKRGVGCRFVDLTQKKFVTIRNCFETFKDTLPVL